MLMRRPGSVEAERGIAGTGWLRLRSLGHDHARLAHSLRAGTLHRAAGGSLLLKTDLCPVCGHRLDQRPDLYYECRVCGGVFSEQQLADLELLR